MSKKSRFNSAAEKIDPTLPFTEIEIDGKTYKMCFNHRALARAEVKLLAAGHDANLLLRIGNLTFDSVRTLFAVSLYHYQPEMDFDTALKLFTRELALPITNAMLEAWNGNMPKPEADSGRPLEPA
ncbi:hypothetical protein GCM10011507_34880 [Edaphobacter acidisoli]|uniref:Uncharacterized protein n=1 Tax=Edaphobacter acidisoli TaxID=2040573 RepID=A0A916WA84_9BACT|nr:hypothetical protein [Edaphobacter acidisoli]GGA80690.1 hypothetical protein GCM10011507_34880 [Edaphobacter acidisoli]